MNEKENKRIMHPNSLANLKPIQPGQVLNPEGSRAHDLTLKRLKRITSETVKEVIELALTGNLEGLKGLAADPDTEVLKLGIAKALCIAAEKGDWNILERIFERLTGKIPIALDHTSGGQPIPQIVLTMPKNDREAPENGEGNN